MSDSLRQLTAQITSGESLTMDQSAGAIDQMMIGNADKQSVAEFLVALADKGETADEVAGAALAMRQHMTLIRTKRRGIVDTCGTGGGGSKTFNISTSAAIVAAAAGVPVAKHGNRSITSRSGSADVLAELGVNISAPVEVVERCLDELGLCFCFAPLQHPSMKNVAEVRKGLGRRTIFNVLGPLANPAGAEFQVLGAGIPALRPLLGEAVSKLGTSRTLVVSGTDGLGDVTISGTTLVSDVQGDSVTEYEWVPADFGIEVQSTNELVVDTPAESAARIRQVLGGDRGPARDIVVLNAAAALIAAGAAESPTAGVKIVSEAIDSGQAADLLQRLGAMSAG